MGEVGGAATLGGSGGTSDNDLEGWRQMEG